MKKPYQTLSNKILIKNPWFSVQQDEIRLPSGEQTAYNVIRKANAVWIVPVLSDGRVVLINQYRYPISEWCLEIPAGGVLPDSTPEEMAIRELKEEIGGTAQTLKSIGTYWTMNGIGNELGHFYLATGVTLGEQHHEPTEVIELKIVSGTKAVEMAQSGEIADAQSALGILLCKDWLS